MEAAYLSSTQEALKYFSVAEDQGLSDEQASAYIAKYGRNGIRLQYNFSKQVEQITNNFALQLYQKIHRLRCGV